MATSHVEVKAGKRGQAAQKSDYISRRNAYENFRGEGELESTDFGNMPKWADSPKEFWQAADEYERKNATAYREIILALPREMTPAQRQALVEDFIKIQFSDKHAFEWGVHNPKASLEKGDQPHVHIIYSERLRDGNDRSPDTYFKRYNAKAPEKGGCQKYNPCSEISKTTPNAQQKIRNARADDLLKLRQNAQDVSNKHLEAGGYIGKVDMRSLADQGIDRDPEQKLGAKRINKSLEMVEAVLANREAWQALKELQEDELRRESERKLFEQLKTSQAAGHAPDEQSRIMDDLYAEGLRQQNRGRLQADAVEKKAQEVAKIAVLEREASEARERQVKEAKIAKIDVLTQKYTDLDGAYVGAWEALKAREDELKNALAKIDKDEADDRAKLIETPYFRYYGTERADISKRFEPKLDAARAYVRKTAQEWTISRAELEQLGHSFELTPRSIWAKLSGKKTDAEQREENYGYALNHATDPDLAKAAERHERNVQQARYRAEAEQQYKDDEPLRKAQDAKDWEVAQLKNEQVRAARNAERDKPTEPEPSQERDNNTFRP
jgi:hypothetical protein